MAVTYVPFDGRRVSARWAVVLNAARRDGVRFTLTSGNRTMAEQWHFWRLWLSGKGNRAAFPNPFAPHIRKGRAHHALDVNSRDGGEQRLENWLDRQGGSPSTSVNTVSGEAWHLEVSSSNLKRLAKKFDGPRTLRLGNRGEDVQRLQVLLRGTGFYKRKRIGKTFGPYTRTVLKRFQRSKRLKADGVYGPRTRRALERAFDRSH